MLAARIYGPEDYRIEDIPEPSMLADEVLVAPKLVGICGTDVEIFEQTLEFYRSGKGMLPIIPGHEWVGQVVKVASKAHEGWLGKQVVGEVPFQCGKCKTCLT